MMKIALTTEGPSLEDAVSSRFARAPYFLIVDVDTLQCDVVSNTSTVDVAAGLGLKAAWIVVNRHASMVITGRMGGNARRILEEHDVEIVTGVSDISAREAVSQYRSGVSRSNK